MIDQSFELYAYQYFYTLSDPNFQRHNSRVSLRTKFREGIATEEEKGKYEKMLENDRRYQAERRAKQKQQKQDM